MRHRITASLVSEVLGPRDGPFEILPKNQDPRGEYITGVLAPVNASRISDDIESDSDKMTAESVSPDPQEDEDTQYEAVVPSAVSPALDPKSLPRSIGLSFSVEAEEEPQIEICSTWARYIDHRDGWQRQPQIFLTGVVRADVDQNWQAGPSVSLQMRSRSLPQGGTRVSLFLINTTELAKPTQPSTSEFIFQPQIRVASCEGTELLPVRQVNLRNDGNNESLSLEDNSLALLYHEQAALARGHLCGAVWKTIDPERPHPTLNADMAPFAWTDSCLIPETERLKFSPADVRTELTPCYPIAAPEMNWDDEYGQSPVLDPELLAEAWEPSQLRQNLQPLIDGYLAWISRQEHSIAALPNAEQRVATLHLEKCQQAVDRIRQAVDILVENESARLSFCFANKAIALQSRWSRNQVITWRPFQLAFILLNIPALADPFHTDRRICDLLWFPTGGGKTEAYLGLTAFVLALRRRLEHISGGNLKGAGTGVLSRYTLRLLTIQQFRRAVGLITACEFLRVQNINTSTGPVGWRPRDYHDRGTFLWGEPRFSAGLWVGGGVTPNSMLSIGPIPMRDGMIFYAGALDILQGAKRNYDGPNTSLRRNIRAARYLEISGEPAQVLTCPCCKSVLAVPDEGLISGQHTLHFVFECGNVSSLSPAQVSVAGLPLTLDAIRISHHSATRYHTLSMTFTIDENNKLSTNELDEWWYRSIAPILGSNATLLSARPSRPGYFILTFDNSQNNSRQCDFDVYCPNPDCELNSCAWAEQVPLARSERSSAGGPVTAGQGSTETTAALPMISGVQWQNVPDAFRHGVSSRISNRIPIPALTVDDQIYHRCPSLIIATVDKFARLAFEPKAASIFGNVNHYHARWGYYREGAPPSWGNLPRRYRPHPPGQNAQSPLHIQVRHFQPPDLIVQDELHLIEGPLGSMVGLYETAVDLLCQNSVDGRIMRPKYVASTATVRQAEPQVQSLFDRELFQFPPWCLSADDRFFARNQPIHPLDSERAGRLYIAICAPGKGAQTPIIRIWSGLLQSVFLEWQNNQTMELDRFWTLVGYFNAVRELAGALSLFRQDIPERMAFLAQSNSRPLDRWLELSGRQTKSLDLPSILDRLGTPLPDAQDVVFATSMFGTGVDVDRLGLMVVHGQPKTTASYIQATGRVGRRNGGLVVTFFRASRPRDLDHYEFFTGYHHALHRYVEPVTVAPFSPRARERALGPVAVTLLRQARELGGYPVSTEWLVQQRLSGAYFSNACRMGNCRHDSDVDVIPELMEDRANRQPEGRRPPAGATSSEVSSELDRWAALAAMHPNPGDFVYYEPTALNLPQRHVVLGDAQHRSFGLLEAYENAPQSLREIEDTISFET